MSTTYEDFTIAQGSDVAFQLELVELDGSTKNLTGYSVQAKMKKSYNSDTDKTIDFTAIVAQPATDGVVVLSLTNEQTDTLSTRGRYVYDVELNYVDSDGYTIVERILEGKIKVSPSVTR